MRVQRVRKAYEQVADQLVGMITAGELRPGDRLPNEADLAHDFGVSRTTVREALRILATRSLIHTRRGVSGGHFVVHPNVDGISDFLVANYGLLATLNTVTLQDLLEARETLEGTVAALAAVRRDDADLAALKASVPDAIGSLATDRAFEHNRDFHTSLLAATKNPILMVAGRPIYTVLQASAVRRAPSTAVVEQIGRDHLAIVEAVEAGDAAAARRCMDEHLAFLRRNYEPGEGASLTSTAGFDVVGPERDGGEGAAELGPSRSSPVAAPHAG